MKIGKVGNQAKIFLVEGQMEYPGYIGVKYNKQGRMPGEPKDIVKARTLFASEGGRWITGSLPVVDGGFTA